MQVSTNLVLDLQRPNINAIVHAKQNDKASRSVVAKLMSGESAFMPPNGANYMIRYGKSDGTGGMYDKIEDGETAAVTVSQNTATIRLAEQALTAPGPVVMELNIYDSTGAKLTTFSWIVFVEESAFSDEEIVSTNYFNILTEEIARAVQAGNVAQQALDTVPEAAQTATQALADIQALAATIVGSVGIDDAATRTTTTWSSQKIDGELGELRDDLAATDQRLSESIADIVKLKNVVEIDNTYAKVGDGSLSSNAAYKSVKIPVVTESVYGYLCGVNETAAGVCFYNEEPSKTSFISGELGASTNKDVTVPTGAKFAVFTYRKAKIADYKEAVQYKGSVLGMQAEIINLQNEVGNLQNEVGNLQNEVGNLQNEVGNIKPSNFKEKLLLTDLKGGISILEKKRLGNYEAGTRVQDIVDYDGGYVVKIDLSKLSTGILSCDSPYTPTYGGTLRAFVICTGEDDNINMFMTGNWNKIASHGTFLEVDSYGGFTFDIGKAYDEYKESSYGTPKCIYVGYEYSQEHDIYFDGHAILPSWIPSLTETQIKTLVYDEIGKEITKPTLVLPTDSVAVVGHEWNMYFDNVCDCLSDEYDVMVSASTIPSSTIWQYKDVLRILPTLSSVGNHTVKITIVNKTTMKHMDEKTFILHIINDVQLSGKKVIFIGDSLTDAGIYPAEIQHNLSHGGIESLGTRSDTVTINGVTFSVNHEGRAGWATYDYTDKAQADNAVNAFWNGSNFDFSYYMQQQGYVKPDIVCIGLGTNGGDSQRSYDSMDAMIQSIRQYDSGVKILIALITPPATQDGCGKHNHTQSSASLKHNFLNVVRKYLDTYQNTEDENLDVVELYFHLDTLHDFDTVTENASARNPVQVVRQNNNVHPSVYGYLHFADAYYNRILYHLTK